MQALVQRTRSVITLVVNTSRQSWANGEWHPKRLSGKWEVCISSPQNTTKKIGKRCHVLFLVLLEISGYLKLTVLKQWVTISTTECRKISYTDFVYSTIIRSNAFLQSTAWAAIFFFHRFDNFNERQNSKNKSNGLKVLRQSLVKPQLIIPPTLASRQHRGIRNLGTNKNANKE